jgi:hypothetical protein
MNSVPGAGVLEQREHVGRVGQCHQRRLDGVTASLEGFPAPGIRARAGSAAHTVRLPCPFLVKVASRSVPAPRNSAVTGIFSPSARRCSVVRALSPTDAAPNKVNGLFYGGGFDLLGIQTVATVAVLAYSFAVTWVIAKVLNITVGLRIDEAAELRGIDMAAHSESAYLMDEEPVELGSPHRV